MFILELDFFNLENLKLINVYFITTFRKTISFLIYDLVQFFYSGLIAIYQQSIILHQPIYSLKILLFLQQSYSLLHEKFFQKMELLHAIIHKAKSQEPKYLFYSHMVIYIQFLVPYIHKCHKKYFFNIHFLHLPIQSHIILY